MTISREDYEEFHESRMSLLDTRTDREIQADLEADMEEVCGGCIWYVEDGVHTQCADCYSGSNHEESEGEECPECNSPIDECFCEDQNQIKITVKDHLGVTRIIQTGCDSPMTWQSKSGIFYGPRYLGMPMRLRFTSRWRRIHDSR